MHEDIHVGKDRPENAETDEEYVQAPAEKDHGEGMRQDVHRSLSPADVIKNCGDPGRFGIFRDYVCSFAAVCTRFALQKCKLKNQNLRIFFELLYIY